MERSRRLPILRPFASTADPTSEATPAILSMWRSILRRKIIVAAVVVPVLLLTAFLLALTPPTYRATVTILVEQNASRVVSIEQVYAGATSNREYFMSQAQFLRSGDVARRTIRALNFRTPEDFAPKSLGEEIWLRLGRSKAVAEEGTASGEGAETKLLRAFQDSLRVEPVRQSQLIEISFDSRDPKTAARVANAVAQEYIQADMDAKYSMTQQANLWLTRRLGELREKLETSERELQEYREKQGLLETRSGPQTGPNREFEELGQRLVEARVKRTQVEQVFIQVRPDAPNRYEVQAVLSNPAVMRARQVEADAERTFADAAQRYGPNFPAYKAAASELALARENTKRQSDAVIASIVKDFEAAKAAEAALERALARARTSVQELSRKEIGLSVYEREALTNRQIYQTFLERVRQTSAAADVQTAAARVIDPALAPMNPIAPRKSLVFIAAFAVSGLVGILVALLASRLENVINATDQVQGATNLPLLSAIPKATVKGGRSPSKLMVDEPVSTFADAVRLALTGIQLSGLEVASRVTAVTSSIQGEGKSTVAVSLGLACAMSRRTLLIDADLRRPALPAVLEVPSNTPGLGDYVLGGEDLESCIRSVPGSNLWLLSAGGGNVSRSLDVMNHQRFREMLQLLRTRFDEILIDCPPLNPVADGLVIGRLCDAVVMVVKAHDTPLPVVRASVARLSGAGVPIAGVILNQFDVRTARAYYGDESGVGHYGYELRPKSAS